MIPDICTVYTKNPDTLRSLLLNERVVNWRNGLIFRLLFTLSLPGRNLLPLPISILEKSHAELVDTHLPCGGSQESLDHVRACIHHLPNLCVSGEEGRPVSWMLSDELCELRMAYTLPQHLLALSRALMRRMSSACLLPRQPAEPGHH
ncbi:hypothetical protein JOQ06_007034 [Pogonophryne albipinna]|uniref:Glycine N-acyltransferase-like protein n=1 Tax=Pogonophryne albipinna TaxID=1090488 RepID=A0AAD6B013_9TELE|nr:hypothetical protein JOQ06_007034 [Pogonophryne albipinna]